MAIAQRVLVVDRWTETADVLRAVLGPRGIAVDRAAQAPEPTSQASSAPLSALVVDEDAAGAWSLDRPSWDRVPTIVIGTARRPDDPAASGNSRRFLSKPFQYAELLQAIESLLATVDAPRRE